MALTTIGKLHATAEFLMFMLSHFLSPLFDHTRHNNEFLGDWEIELRTIIRVPGQLPGTRTELSFVS